MMLSDMLLDLKRRIEIFQEEEVKIFHRTEVAQFDVPNHWKKWLSNTQLSIGEIIRQLWQPISLHAGKKIVELLSQRIIDIYILSSSRAPLRLGYIFHVEPSSLVTAYLEAWVAGLPLRNDANLNLPSSYRAFSMVHNGFLLTGNCSIGILPVDHLRFLNTRIGQMSLLSKLTYDPAALLEFCGDGLGNARCFDYSKPIDGEDFLTVDWDHESLQVGNPLTFWEFAEEFIAKNMR